ncbi:MAG: A/G-specific adenine glycosylase [Lachnospiraceae bacterium]|nr:A/G-specific adenine glycosylase [Lachnospiraceae bacterium]
MNGNDWFFENLEVLEREEAPLSAEERVRAATKPLLSWFRKNARVLPWREDPTPYHVWISEIMLQQTRVEAVKDYYRRFLEALPDIPSLAEVPEERLLKLWEGLGYYNRARNLKKAAKEAVACYGGNLPASYKELLLLPGIGSYTAGAIASIAYGIPEPAVDGNVLRVVSRLLADRGDILKQSVKRQMEELLREIMPKDAAGAFNQALMELGALVCVPNGAPHCQECPVKGLCLARREDLTGQIPVKTPKKARVIEERTVFAVRKGEQVLLHKRPEKGLLAGLYELPGENQYLGREEALCWLGVEEEMVEFIEPLPDAKHIFSHVEWRMKGYYILLKEGAETEAGFFTDRGELQENYALPGAFRAYAKYLFQS